MMSMEDEDDNTSSMIASRDRGQSHHIPMDSKVLGGFVQPGLAMVARFSNENTVDTGKKKTNDTKAAKSATADSESDEDIPALAHLEPSGASMDKVSTPDVDDIEFEEKKFEFETKP